MVLRNRDEFKMKKGETEDEYEIRICSLHDEYELSWDDITAIINSTLGWNYTESRYRKLWKAYCLGVRSTAVQKRMRPKSEGEYLKAELSSQDEDSSPAYSEEEKVLREKYATTADRLSYTRKLRQDARFERFYKDIAKTIEEIGRLDVPIYLGPKSGHDEKKYIVPIADMHLGAKFESVNNSYSIAEAKRRMDYAASRIRDFIVDKGLHEITILGLGDLIQGILRIGDVALNETEVVTAFVYAIRLIAGFLNTLSAYCHVNYIQVCYSNHEQPRYLGTKASELAGEDMGKISFAYLQDVLANNPNVTVEGDVDRDYYEFKIFDFNVFATHGHQIKNPFDVNKDLVTRHRKFYDYVFLAHTRSAKELIAAEGEHHDIEILIAPSIIGSDPYADKLFVGSKAAIKIFGFEPVYGHTESYKIILN